MGERSRDERLLARRIDVAEASLRRERQERLADIGKRPGARCDDAPPFERRRERLSGKRVHDVHQWCSPAAPQLASERVQLLPVASRDVERHAALHEGTANEPPREARRAVDEHLCPVAHAVLVVIIMSTCKKLRASPRLEWLAREECSVPQRTGATRMNP